MEFSCRESQDVSLKSWQTDRSKHICFKTHPTLKLAKIWLLIWHRVKHTNLLSKSSFTKKTPHHFPKIKPEGIHSITFPCHQQDIPAFTSSHPTTQHCVQVKNPQYYPKQHHGRNSVSKLTLCLPGQLCKTTDYAHYRNNPIQTLQWRVHWPASPLSDSTGWATALRWVHLEYGRK